MSSPSSSDASSILRRPRIVGLHFRIRVFFSGDFVFFRFAHVERFVLGIESSLLISSSETDSLTSTSSLRNVDAGIYFRPVVGNRRFPFGIPRVVSFGVINEHEVISAPIFIDVVFVTANQADLNISK